MKTNPIKPQAISTNLLAEGKSRRLLAMRERAQKCRSPQQPPSTATIASKTDNRHTAWQHAKQQIDLRLSEILAGYPAGKQASFFKLRYGISLNALKQRPLIEICQRLGIDLQRLPPNLPPTSRYDGFESS